MTMAELLSIASDIGIVSLLFVAFYGGAKQIWVWGWSYREKVHDLESQLEKAQENFQKQIEKVEKDRDEWKELALTATDIGKRVVSVAEKTVGR